LRAAMVSACADAVAEPRWRERWISLRNSLIANPRFQRWAAASPLTRRVARRKARELFDICAGFAYSQILLACVRLRLFEKLAAGPHSADDLSACLALPLDSTMRLLRAAAALRLLRALPCGRFALGDLGASLLGNPSVAAFIEHHEMLYQDLRDPVALLRGETTTRLSQFWPYAAAAPGSAPAAAANASSHDPESYRAYSALMSRTQPLVNEDILDAYPLANHRCLLDVGGGEGAFLASAAARAPSLALKLFDLPPVVARAKQGLAARGLAERVELVGGSFLADPLPTGADIISLVRIVHDHDDASAAFLLRAVFAALPRGGTLMLAEPMASTPAAEAMGDAYFGFYLLAMGRGRARSLAELSTLLEGAGFGKIRALATRRPLLGSLLLARRV
jgi:demethylspheroidene O-methyltransferase